MSSRKDALLKLIQEAQELLEAWNKKKLYSENPTEAKRSDMEIDRLGKIIDEHYATLGKLEQADTSNPSTSSDANTLDDLIAQNQLLKALKKLQIAFQEAGNQENQDAILLLMGRLSSLENQNRQGLIQQNDYQIGINKIGAAIVSYKNELED